MDPANVAIIAEVVPTIQKVHVFSGGGKLLQLLIDAGNGWREPAASKQLNEAAIRLVRTLARGVGKKKILEEKLVVNLSFPLA